LWRALLNNPKPPIVRTFSYIDCPTILAFAQSDVFIRGLMGPFGSGKSSGCVAEIIRRAMLQEPSPDGVRRTRWAVIRNTYRQLEDTTIKTFMDWVPENLLGNYAKGSHTYTIDKLRAPDGGKVEIEVLFRALDRPDQVDNLLSLELTGAWVNEAREVPKAIIDALGGRVGRYPSKIDGGATWYGIFFDTNPPDDDSWWYKLFEDDRPENCEVFKQPGGDEEGAENIPNLPTNYYANMSVGKDPDWIKVYVKGHYGYVKEGKPVYSEYNDSIHTSEEAVPIKGLTIYRGWDFGLTPCCIFTQMLPNGQWIVFDELTSEDMGIKRFGEEVLTYCSKFEHLDPIYHDIGDPSGEYRNPNDETSCFDVLHDMGIIIEGGLSQDPEIRIECVKKPLNTMINGQPGMLVHPDCVVARKGFLGRYQFRRMMTSKEQYTSKPDKNEWSHIQDAIQYVATLLFGGALKDSNKKKLDYKSIYG